MLYPHPILRLTIPIAAGIFFTGCFPGLVPMTIWWVLTLLGGIGVGMLVLRRSLQGQWVFGCGAAFWCFTLGALLMEHHWQEVSVDWSGEKQVYEGRICSLPIEKPKSLQLEVEVNEKRVRLYLPKDTVSQSLSLGHRLLFYTIIQPPVNRGNPEEFDYERYCLLHGISGSAWVPSDNWQLLNLPRKLTLKQQALLLQQQVVKTYDSWNLGADEKAILSALTIGDKSDLDPTLRQDFSVAGIAHVLALSGMHIGILWMLLDFILFPLKRSAKGRWIKWLLIVGLLWSFAFVTGLQPSVIRAVVMCMLLEFARLVHRPLLSLNTLGMAALAMLVLNPALLFDVGFQLSFVAVASIFLLYGPLYRLIPSLPRWLNPVWSLLCVSVVAQIGTAPLSMYYFGQFSVYFLLTNLVAAALVPLILYGCAVAWAFCWWPMFQDWITKALQLLLFILNRSADIVSHLPGADAVDYQPHPAEVWSFYLFLLLFCAYLQQPLRRNMFRMWVSGLVVGVLHLVLSFPQAQSPHILFYHLSSCTAVHLIEPDGTSWVASNRPDTVMSCLKPVAGRFWKKEHLQQPVVLPCSVHEQRVEWEQQLLSWRGKHIGVFTDGKWKRKRADVPMELDYALIGRGFQGDLSALLRVFLIRQVVLDATLYDSQVERLQTECELLRIPCVNLSAAGSYRIPL